MVLSVWFMYSHIFIICGNQREFEAQISRVSRNMTKYHPPESLRADGDTELRDLKLKILRSFRRAFSTTAECGKVKVDDDYVILFFAVELACHGNS